MKKIILIPILAILVLMSCNPIEDPIQLNEDSSQLNNFENALVNELVQNKALQAMFSETAMTNSSKNSNNGNGVLFTVDGEFWALGFSTNIPGVAAFIYETGFVDIKILPQENRLEFFMHTNNVNLEVIDFRGDTPPAMLYTNYCMDEIAIANLKIQTEYWTATSSNGDPIYLWNWNQNTYTSDTGILNIKMNDAYVDGDCTEPTTNKRLKMVLVNTPNSNSGNSADRYTAQILDH